MAVIELCRHYFTGNLDGGGIDPRDDGYDTFTFDRERTAGMQDGSCLATLVCLFEQPGSGVKFTGQTSDAVLDWLHLYPPISV